MEREEFIKHMDIIIQNAEWMTIKNKRTKTSLNAQLRGINQIAKVCGVKVLLSELEDMGLK